MKICLNCNDEFEDDSKECVKLAGNEDRYICNYCVGHLNAIFALGLDTFTDLQYKIIDQDETIPS